LTCLTQLAASVAFTQRPFPEEAIAAAGNRLEQATIVAERLPGCGYVKPKRILCARLVRPNAVHDVVLADELAARLSQNSENFECAAPERYDNSALPQFTPGEINLPHAEGVYRSLACISHFAAP
jgi:hypothetical protein